MEYQWFKLLDGIADALGVSGRHALLYGPPGTGKSAFFARRGAHERLSIHETMSPDALLGTWRLERDGNATSMQWCDGPAIRAMRKGVPLIIDEVDRAGGDVVPVLHAIADDRDMAAITLPTGEVVKPADGFFVVATTNASPQELPPALLDRFGITLHADEPHPAILENLPTALRDMVQAGMASHDWQPIVTARRVLAYMRLCQFVGNDLAAAAVFGSGAKDIQTAVVTAGNDTGEGGNS